MAVPTACAEEVLPLAFVEFAIVNYESSVCALGLVRKCVGRPLLLD